MIIKKKNQLDANFKLAKEEVAAALLNEYKRLGTPEELNQLLDEFEDMINKNAEEEYVEEEIPATYVYVYFKNGNVDKYKVDNEFKAREHAEKILTNGYVMRVGNKMEWFGSHLLDKVCWDIINK